MRVILIELIRSISQIEHVAGLHGRPSGVKLLGVDESYNKEKGGARFRASVQEGNSFDLALQQTLFLKSLVRNRESSASISAMEFRTLTSDAGVWAKRRARNCNELCDYDSTSHCNSCT